MFFDDFIETIFLSHILEPCYEIAMLLHAYDQLQFTNFSFMSSLLGNILLGLCLVGGLVHVFSSNNE